MSTNRNLFWFLLLSPMLWSQQQKSTKPVLDSLESKKTPYELEEVILVDSRFALKRSESGKPIVKINRKEIEAFQGEELSTVLRNYSGIDILGSRTYPGQNKTFSIRGGRNRQVLVMIDGIRVSDPARIDNDFELTFLNLENIESIEIQKGAASTLYGSSAATGIINIITKKSTEELQFEAQTSLGTVQTQNDNATSLSTFRNSFFISNSFGAMDFKLNASHFYTDGMSAVIGDEKDPFERYSIGTQIRYKANSKWDWSIGYDKEFIQSDYDDSFYLSDAPFSYTKELDRFRFAPNFNYSNGGVSLLFGYQKTDRDFKSDYPYATKSENINLDLFNKLVIADKIYTVLGFQHQSNYANYEGFEKTFQYDGYFNVVYLFSDNFRVNSGLRLNNHSTYGNNLTYNINPSYTIQLKESKSIKILSALSSAFIAPSLYQLYDPYSGNDALKPEENQSFEAGINFNQKGFDSTIMFFNRKENPSLIYDFSTYRYGNANEEALYRGVEFDLNLDISQKMNLVFNYTFTETEDGDLRYLPKHAFNGSLNFSLDKRTSLLLNVQNIGDRFALDNTTVLDAYTLLDLRYRRQFKNPKWSAFIAVTNIFNEEYIEIEGFATRGRNLLTGLSFKMN